MVLCVLFQLERPGEIDLLWLLRSVGEHDDSIRTDFDEAIADGHLTFRIAGVIGEKAGRFELGNELGVSRQDAEFAIKTGNFDAVDVCLENLAFWSHNLKVDSQCRISLPAMKLHLAGARNGFVYTPDKIECLFGQVIVNAGNQLLKSADCLFEGNELALEAGELLSDVERL